MYQEAEVYVRNKIELEKSLKENNRLAHRLTAPTN